MAKIRKNILYVSFVLVVIGTSIVANNYSETIFPILISPFSLILVLVVPGACLYMILTQSNKVDSDMLVYGVGLSAALLMVLGVLLVISSRMVGFRTFSPSSVLVGYTIMLVGICIGVEKRVPGNDIEIALPTAVRPYLLVTIAASAGIGAITVSNGQTNRFVLIGLALIVVAYVIGMFHPIHRVGLLYFLGLGLLLHNTLITEYFLWGDQAAEAILVKNVLQMGHWNPSNLPYANKRVMLRIVILHPMHILLTGLDMRFAFKIIHPLLFATAPVALYQTFKDRGRPNTGYVAAGSLMFFFGFFTVLSRNTRTASAILFMILFMKVLLDIELNDQIRTILLIVFGSSVFVSHYGTGYMFLAMLVGGFILTIGYQSLIERSYRKQEEFPIYPVLIIGLISYSWYSYVSVQSVAFNTLVGFVSSLILKIQNGFFQPTNSATAQYATTTYSSTSLSGIKLLTALLFLLIGLGWLSAVIQSRNSQDQVEANISYLAISAVAGSLAVITFLPVERFNTARTIAVVLSIVSPYFPIGVQAVLSQIPKRHQFPEWTSEVICLALLIPFFIFSTGLFAATINNEYSPNVVVYQDEVIEEGSIRSKTYLYKQHLPDAGPAAGSWIMNHGSGTIYGSRWPGNPSYGVISNQRLPYEYIGNISSASPSDCIYLSPYSVEGGVIAVPRSVSGDGFIPTSTIDITERSKVYTNGKATLNC